jgi:scyllo-inositol 2-dehydrogenase (NADP+)
MNEKMKLAVVGFGGQGNWHVQHALKSDVVELAGIYDIDPEKQKKAVSEGIKSYSSLDELVNDPQVELVTVATPNDVHCDIVVKALNSGKNVICEKPVAMSVDVLDKMIAAANKNGKLFTVHQNRRWDVDYLAIKSIIKSGEIGDTLRIESRIHGSRGIPSDWRCHKQYGGGMILDWGVHLIDQMLQLIPDEIDSVYCNTTHITTDEVDDGCRIEIFFKTGKTAYIEVGTYNFIALPRFYMLAKSGTAEIVDWTEKAKVSKLKFWNEKEVLPVQTAAGITKTMAPRDSITVDSYEIDKPASDVHDFYRNVVKAVRGEEKQIVTHKEIRRVLRVMELAFESDEKKAPVKYTD